MKHFQVVSFVAIAALLFNTAAWGQVSGDYRSAATGNWNSTATWETYNGSAWVVASATPTSADGAITILSGHTVTITAAVIVDQVTVDAGGQVTVAPTVTDTLANGTGTDLTVNGTWLNQGGTWTMKSGAAWTVGSGGTYIHNTTSGISSPIGVATLDAASNFIYRGSSTLTPSASLSGRTYGNLSFESTSGSWTLSATGASATTVNGNFSIGSGVTFSSAMTNTLSIAGGLTNNGIWTPKNSQTVVFNGSSSQAVTGSPGRKITTSNSSGVSLNSSVQIDTITLTSGKLTLGSNNLTVATISGGSSSSYVVASSTGQLRQTVSATGSFTLPIGDATNYSPASVNVTAGTFSSAYVGATVAASKHGNNTSATDYINRYWTITTSGITSQSYDVTCTYVTGDVAGTESNLYGGCWNGSSWTIQSAVNPGAHTLSATGISIASTDFTAGEASALPVTFTSMTAKGGRESAEIRWSTATEVNSSSFEIERQLVGSNQWLNVGNVKAAGASNSPKEYSFIDHSVVPGRYDYRLLEIDANGSSKYFGDTKVEVGQAAKVLTLGDNYPNPFNPATKIEFTLPENGRAVLKVFNVIGQEVATLFSGEAVAGRIYQTEFYASRFATGLYFYSLEYGNRKLVKKMLLLK